MSDNLAALAAACRYVGIDASKPELIRAGENTLYRLPRRIVARVTRKGQLVAATKEVRISQWLQALDIPVVQALAGIPQPVAVNGRAVTFWHELPAHRLSTLAELATVLRRLHDLPPPDFELSPVAAFVRQRERIAEAATLSLDDRDWLLGHLAELQARYDALPDGRPWCAVDGDAWAGNLVVTGRGLVLIDPERFAYGPPEWDLTSIAVDYTTFGELSDQQWAEFCQCDGYDVTTWSGFDILRDARELRKVTLAAQMADQRADIADRAAYRLACIQGRHGSRPWGWTGVP